MIQQPVFKMKVGVLCKFLVFSVTPYFGYAYNILGIFHFPARSTVKTFEPFFKRLTEREHNVTIISHFHLSSMEKNFNEIYLGGAHLGHDAKLLSVLGEVERERISSLFFPYLIGGFTKKVCSALFSSKEVQNLYNSNTKFDIVIINIFQTESVYQIAKKFECPIIGVHSTAMPFWVGDRFAIPTNPAYLPVSFMPFSQKMSFWERLDNTLASMTHYFIYNFFMLAKDRDCIKEYFGDGKTTWLDNSVYNTSLFLVNTHYTVNLPRPLVPNVVEVGGINIGQSKSLPKVSQIINTLYTLVFQ